MFSKKFIQRTTEYTMLEKSVPAPYFRKRFFLANLPPSAQITVCGLGFYELYLNGENITKGRFAPDAVILGLGTNDAAYLERHPEYAKQFSSDYADFLRYVRQKRPNAYIVCVYGMMGRNVQIDAGIMQAIENLNDEKISYLSTFEKNNVGADGHPSFVAQKEYSEILSEYLTSLLWTTEA